MARYGTILCHFFLRQISEHFDNKKSMLSSTTTISLSTADRDQKGDTVSFRWLDLYLSSVELVIIILCHHIVQNIYIEHLTLIILISIIEYKLTESRVERLHHVTQS